MIRNEMLHYLDENGALCAQWDMRLYQMILIFLFKRVAENNGPGRGGGFFLR